jgi:peptidoglycan/xylan/chitin deacetylase (PgdA/CDA1 family)
VVLTFDDGYVDVLDTAAPELKRRGLPALLCVTTGVVSGAQRGFPVDHWYAAVQAAWPLDPGRVADRARLVDGPEKRAFVLASREDQSLMLERLRRTLGVEAPPAIPPTLDAGGLSALVREGWMLGSHGERHTLLPLLPAEDAAREIVGSRAFFALHGLPQPAIIAYPDGATCPRTEAQAKEAGYTVGLALGSRFATPEDAPLRLPRLIPTNDAGWFERRLLPLFSEAG